MAGQVLLKQAAQVVHLVVITLSLHQTQQPQQVQQVKAMPAALVKELRIIVAVAVVVQGQLVVTDQQLTAAPVAQVHRTLIQVHPLLTQAAVVELPTQLREPEAVALVEQAEKITSRQLLTHLQQIAVLAVVELVTVRVLGGLLVQVHRVLLLFVIQTTKPISLLFLV